MLIYRYVNLRKFDAAIAIYYRIITIVYIILSSSNLNQTNEKEFARLIIIKKIT